MRTAILGLLASSIALAACGPTSTDDDNDDQLDAPVGKADTASVPGGAYTNATPKLGALSTIALDEGHGFTLTALVACAGGGTCAPETETGTFLLTHSTNSSKRYVRLYAADGSDLGRYQWKLHTGSVSLISTEDSSATWFTMAQTAAPAPAPSCAADTDCTGLVPEFCRVCADGSEACAHWSCVADACAMVSCD